jgi:hypothetical protein
MYIYIYIYIYIYVYVYIYIHLFTYEKIYQVVEQCKWKSIRYPLFSLFFVFMPPLADPYGEYDGNFLSYCYKYDVYTIWPF